MPPDPLLSPSPQSSPIQLSLDAYEDLFSDFDSRPMHQRLLSDDFLQELRRASLDRAEEGLLLVMDLPARLRQPAAERVIKERISAHVLRNRERLEGKLAGEQRLGFRMLALGVAFMFAAAWLHHTLASSFGASFVVVLLEPAGWFTFWEGLNRIVFRSREAGPELSFFRKLSNARIRFQDAVAVVKPNGGGR